MDQNEKEEKRKAWVRFRVMDVLRNHDQEARVIESQIAAERAALAEDLKEILESAFPSSQLSDAGVRVQSSPDPDARMVNMVTRTEKRRNTADRRIGALERQAQQIEDVLSAILDMDSQSKCVLLALYYPFRSYKEAADFLHMAKATIYRQRKTALDSLFATMYTARTSAITMRTRSWASAGRTEKSISVPKSTSSRRTPKRSSALQIRRRSTGVWKCSVILRSRTGSRPGRRPASAPTP